MESTVSAAKVGRRGSVRSLAAAVAVACAIASALDQYLLEAGAPTLATTAKRSLFTTGSAEEGDGFVYAWARDNLRQLSDAPDPSRETPLFWHVHKSGGSGLKNLYRCFGKRVAVKSQPDMIMEAAQSGFVRSGQADVIFTSSPNVAATHMFDPDNKGRAIVVFRHPVERLVSQFFYLQIAKWEPTYRPEWSKMSLVTWAQGFNMDNDMVKRLAGTLHGKKATKADLRAAKSTIRAHFLVGLTDKMEESVRRFNAVVGVDESDLNIERCMRSYFGKDGLRKNSNPHSKLEEDSPAWKLLAKKNALDMQLYEYALELFDSQKEIIDSWANLTDTSIA